ncbi:MAG TPA: sugar ABC transporter ATP-binding protein [Dongiaceae bacterium]|nr:sugar ABC transporter ATP-binding protein [Dongiaceae bacterium]
MSVPLLQLTRVAKSFGAVRALRGVSFDLRPGEVHALLGENGAGKSTLMKIITGAHSPDEGLVEIGGRRVRHLSPAAARRLGIACIYQQLALFPDLTVAENIALRRDTPRAFDRVRPHAQRERARQLLQRVGAAVSPDSEVRGLSLPAQQLVEIASALAAGARIIIMDEPTASLTRPEVERLFSLVRGLRADGAGIIYISHRLEEIFQLADRVTVLRDGESVGTRVLLPDTPDAVRRTEANVTAAELIQLMVGREVSQLYPPAAGPTGGSVLSLKAVGCAAAGVHRVTLDLRAGEIIGLSGLVGAGRTELARVLFGLTPADCGQIVLAGQPVAIGSPRQAIALGIAYLPEDRRRHGLILDLPVAANISMAIHRRLFPRGWLRLGAERSLALEMIRALAIVPPTPQTPARSLSGGNQQKTALARWLAAKPKVLLLDEPTQGVDVGAKSEIHKLIRRLAAEGLAVLLISSDLLEVLGMSDRIAVMRGGTITAMLPGHSEPQVVMAAALGQGGGGVP